MRRFLRWLLLASSLILFGCGGARSGGSGQGGGGATHFSVSGPASGAVGFAIIFTVTALDASNGVVTNYSGTVRFTSSDPAAALPHNLTLMNGTGAFSATLNTAGIQTISATDALLASLTGSLSVTAIADAFPVNSFGAKGDGQSDDTAAIQNAINAASAA